MSKKTQDSFDAERFSFLTEDFKETGAHLRDTDRKLSVLVQIYTGAFVLVATLVTDNLLDKAHLSGLTGIALIVVFIFFTEWLFRYSLRSKETKQTYIWRMNFLRTELHKFFRTGNKNLPGYWTLVKDFYNLKDELPEDTAQRIGLDNLYPDILGKILYFLCFLFALAVTKYVFDSTIHCVDCSLYNMCWLIKSLASIHVWYFAITCFFGTLVLAIFFTKSHVDKLTKESNKKIEYIKAELKLSSERIKDKARNSSKKVAKKQK